MKRLLLISAWLLSLNTDAQLYISTGKIEYEVRTNNHKMFGDGIWGEMMKDKLPQFSTKYYGVQTFLIRDVASGETLQHFTIITGVAMEDDLRAEVDLLRAELDMLKRAFRRHCLETAG